MMAASRLSHPFKIDVFINFRVKDTRRIFIGHLYKALKDKAIGAFYDRDSLETGTQISELLTAIDHSRLSIVVFSENYADSILCLRELVRIVECRDKWGQIVVPIFYGVEPLQIHPLSGNFATAFERHDRNSEIGKEEVRSWKSALKQISDMSGFVSSVCEDDSALIIDIVQEISKLIKFGRDDSELIKQMDAACMQEKHINTILDEQMERFQYDEDGKVRYCSKVLSDEEAHELLLQYAFGTEQQTRSHTVCHKICSRSAFSTKSFGNSTS